MSIEITPLLPFLLGLTVLVLVLEAVRSTRLFGRALLGALLLLCAGLNPAEAAHARALREQAQAGAANGLRGAHSAERAPEGREYQDLGIASWTLRHGRLLSFGILGVVFIVDIERRMRRTGPGPATAKSSDYMASERSSSLPAARASSTAVGAARTRSSGPSHASVASCHSRLGMAMACRRASRPSKASGR